MLREGWIKKEERDSSVERAGEDGENNERRNQMKGVGEG